MEIIEKEIGHAIEIEEKARMFKMASVMGRDYKNICEYVNGEIGEDMGIPYARYLSVDWESQMSKNAFANFIEIFTKKWHFQVGIPVGKELTDQLPMKYTFIKQSKYIKKIHLGSYQNLGKTYKKIYIWAKEKNYKFGNESIEFYLNDPNEVEKESLETMILVPIVN